MEQTVSAHTPTTLILPSTRPAIPVDELYASADWLEFYQRCIIFPFSDVSNVEEMKKEMIWKNAGYQTIRFAFLIYFLYCVFTQVDKVVAHLLE